MSDVEDLVAVLAQGDPEETVDLATLTAMAQAAIRAHWIPCPHADHITEATLDSNPANRYCQRCGARFVVEAEPTDA